MSLLKNVALRGGTDLNPDERAFLQFQVPHSIAVLMHVIDTQSTTHTRCLVCT